MMDAPQYKSAPIDPGFNALTAQNRQDNIDAVQARMTGETNSLQARYGTLTSGDSAAVMARYASLLSLAQGGASPPLNPLKSPLAA
jgi:hypothetical protein